MIHLVLGALRAAGVANLGTKLAHAVREIRATGHFTFCVSADVGATAVEFDTTGHHLHVLFVKAGRRAMFAGYRAIVAGLDAILVIVGGHRTNF